jgi:hypothetical protein
MDDFSRGKSNMFNRFCKLLTGFPGIVKINADQWFGGGCSLTYGSPRVKLIAIDSSG